MDEGARPPAPGGPAAGRTADEYAAPDPPPFAVRRDRLVAVVDLAVQHALTVVVGPSGAGKTVLLAQWASTHATRRVRWITVSPEHNDPTRFARALLDALASPWWPTEGVLSDHDGAHPTGRALIGAIRNDLGALPPTTLVFDDFQLLTNPVLLDELVGLIDHGPRSLHVVLATQVDPPARYYRLAVGGTMVELRQDDLAFTVDEAAELVDRLAGPRLTTDHVRKLVQRTEGWAVGLQLAALSLREIPDIDGFVETFAEGNRHVADYLTEHVLARQHDDTRRFLLATSVLDQIDGRLADFVTGEPGSLAMIEDLDRQSMFISRVGARRDRFRYHPMFRAMLRHHLREEDPGREHDLLLRAADWHLARRDLDTGVRYLAEARAWDRVLETAAEHSGDLYLTGRLETLVHWIEQVPEEHRRGNTRILLLHAAALIGSDAVGPAGALLADFTPATPGDAVVADLLRAWAALQRGDTEATVAAAHRVLGAVDGVEAFPDVIGMTSGADDITAGVRVMLGTALFYLGDLAGARDALATADHGHLVGQASAQATRGLVDAWTGRLNAAEQQARRTLAIAEQVGLDWQQATTHALLALTHVAYERDDLERAARLGDEAAGTSPASPAAANLVATERALVALATEGPAAALAILSARRSDTTRMPPPPAVEARRRAVEAQVLVAMGELGGAEKALDAAPVDTLDVRSSRVRLAVERHDVAAAQALLDRWPDDGTPRGRSEGQLWRAVVAALAGDEAEASELLASAVSDAEAEQDVGLFRVGGHHALALVRALHRRSPTPFLRAVAERPEIPAAVRPTRELVEQLTEREATVLTLLPTRLSNVEIAEQLGVSLNTVKTHLKHIYRKLAVTGRTEAVDEAERIRLL